MSELTLMDMTKWRCSRCHIPDPDVTSPQMLAALIAVSQWTALDGDGISEPVRSLVLDAIQKAEGR